MMDDNKIETGSQEVVIAIAQADDKLRGVAVRRKGGGFEVIGVKSAGKDSWHSLVQELSGDGQYGGERAVAVGFNSTGVGFYHIEVPAVKADELAALVRLQAESRLPLPAEQMELCWRTETPRAGHVEVTIAAARKKLLEDFVGEVRGLEPSKIILDCEAIVAAWIAAFGGAGQQALVLSAGSNSTQVCLTEEGRLNNAMTLDIGTADFSTGQMETAERFAQDVKSIVDLFGFSQEDQLPVFVLSDGSEQITQMVSSLGSAGLNAKSALPDVSKLTTGSDISDDDIYQSRAALGVALMAFDLETTGLDIFKRLYTRPVEKRCNIYSPKTAGIIAAAMLALLIVVFYVVDVTSLKAIEKRLYSSETEAKSGSLIERQKLMKTLALQRPELLKLFKQISGEENSGILLNSFSFKRRQRVSIGGQADNDEQLYKFQKNLLSKKGINDVRIQSVKKQAKGSKLNFSMTFHYKNFTKKKS